jgi:hypothetical protein
LLEVLSVLVDKGSSGASVGDALPVVKWAGNAQKICVGSLLTMDGHRFMFLLAPARLDTLAWAGKQAYANYKQNIQWYEHGYRGKRYSYSNLTKIGAFLIREHYRDILELFTRNRRMNTTLVFMPDLSKDEESFPEIEICNDQIKYFQGILQFREGVINDFPMSFQADFFSFTSL